MTALLARPYSPRVRRHGDAGPLLGRSWDRHGHACGRREPAQVGSPPSARRCLYALHRPPEPGGPWYVVVDAGDLPEAQRLLSAGQRSWGSRPTSGSSWLVKASRQGGSAALAAYPRCVGQSRSKRFRSSTERGVACRTSARLSSSSCSSSWSSPSSSWWRSSLPCGGRDARVLARATAPPGWLTDPMQRAPVPLLGRDAVDRRGQRRRRAVQRPALNGMPWRLPNKRIKLARSSADVDITESSRSQLIRGAFGVVEEAQ